MRPILVLIRKEFQQIFRDRHMMAIIFAVPLIQIFILGNAMTTDVKNLRLVVFDQDRSLSTREVVSSLENCGYFILKAQLPSRAEVGKWIQMGRADLGIIFPKDFQADLETGKSPTVQILVDGQNSSTSSIGLGYAAGILQDFAKDIILQKMTVSHLRKAGAHLFDAQTRIFYNPTLESVYYMIPGIVTVLLTIVTMMLTAMGLVREKEIGTLEQLMVTPIKPHQLLLGKLIPFVILGYIAMAIILTFGVLYFGLPMEGSLLVTAAATLLFILSTLGMGLFISTISSTQQQAMFVAWFFMVFGMLMSGFFYAVENMPAWAQKITLINPLRYYIAVLREVFLKSAGIQHLQFEFVALAVMGILTLTLTVARFRAQLK